MKKIKMAIKEMTSRERFRAIMHFQEPDRLMFGEGWDEETIFRWHQQGLPRIMDPIPSTPNHLAPRGNVGRNSFQDDYGMNYIKYFGFDSLREPIGIDLGPIPRFIGGILEEDERYLIERNEGGVTLKVLKGIHYAMPAYIDWAVHDRDDWKKVKKRYNPLDPRRYPNTWGEDLFEYYRNLDRPVTVIMEGFWGIGRLLMGIKNFALLFYRDPDMAHDMIDFWTDYTIEALRQCVETLKSTIDLVLWHEDFAHKHGPNISPKLFREFMLPGYKKINDFFKRNGIDTIMMISDGDIRLLIPLLTEGGITGHLPLECACGLDIHDLRKDFPECTWSGNLDKRVLTKGKDAIKKEVEYKVPFMKEARGCIPKIDHGIPPDVPLENFLFYLDYLKKFL